MRVPEFLILNFFTKGYLKQVDIFPFLNFRLKSMIGDFWFVMAIGFPWFLLMVIPFEYFMSTNEETTNLLPVNLFVAIIPWTILMFMMLNKDCINGRSAAKRIFGFKVIDFQTKELASDFQCMIRNITMIISPLEAVFVLISPKRRIGDYIAGTEVVKADIIPIESLLSELKEKQSLSGKLIITSIGVAVILTLIACSGMF